MRFRWDWLSPVLQAPYVPTLGPVHPEVLSVDLFHDVLSAADTGRFLPYDKDRRWFSSKDERVIIKEIIHAPDLTLIPTLSTRGRGTIKLHHFAIAPPDFTDLSRQARCLGNTYGAASAKVIWFHQNPSKARNRIMLKTYAARDQIEQPEHIIELGHCEIADTFPAFADQLGVAGFAFLYQRMSAGCDDGPVLVAVDDDRIVGAVGPLTTLTDAVGVRMVPPQYYAVHPDYRRRGHGRALWKAALAWGLQHGAAYKVLQAQTGAPAEYLYLSEGLATLGFINTRTLSAV
ncbi:GNAT family N-acetyltransferase [Actinomadura adrarensis]|uniref:GNAT family N-acetyltransferase n=1 Tax=Actinomadura adrarensis TaxID=1819600 RepID=A0ABW3CUN5_9ACTN